MQDGLPRCGEKLAGQVANQSTWWPLTKEQVVRPYNSWPTRPATPLSYIKATSPNFEYPVEQALGNPEQHLWTSSYGRKQCSNWCSPSVLRVWHISCKAVLLLNGVFLSIWGLCSSFSSCICRCLVQQWFPGTSCAPYAFPPLPLSPTNCCLCSASNFDSFSQIDPGQSAKL